jgi:hypothetical protein
MGRRLYRRDETRRPKHESSIWLALLVAAVVAVGAFAAAVVVVGRGWRLKP